MRSDTSSSNDRWRKALYAVIPPIALADTSIIDFLLDEIVQSGFNPSIEASGDNDDVEDEEVTLHSVLAEHLETLLDMSEADIIFTVRDLLDAYRTPRSNEDEDGGGGGRLADAPSSECELCGRSMSLTIHHLFPRSEHDYYLRHPPPGFRLPDDRIRRSGAGESSEQVLTKHDLLVRYRAWLCRPCHSAVHRIVPDNRELGREYHSVQKLLENEDVQRWVGYASKLRDVGGNRQKMGLRQKR